MPLLEYIHNKKPYHLAIPIEPKIPLAPALRQLDFGHCSILSESVPP